MGNAMTPQNARDAAMERVARNRGAYIAKAVAAGERLLQASGRVTSEMVRKQCPVPDDMEPRVLGVVMRELVKTHGLTRITWTTTDRKSCHCRPIAVWGK